MRRQLVAALAGLALVTLALYVVPRTITTVDLVRAKEVERMERSALLIGRGIEILVASGAEYGPESFPNLVQPGEEVTIVTPTMSEPLVIGSVEGRAHTVREQVGDIAITLRTSAADIDQEVADALRPVVYLGALALLVAVGLAILISGRLVKPFVALARYTDGTYAIDGTIPAAPRSSLPEANVLADALDNGARRVQAMIEQERRFSANASHQLRTPLAALRLRLEDLRSWPEVPATVRDEIDEVVSEADRLSGTISDLLTLARSGGIGSWDEVDVNHVATAAVERWRDLLERDGRTLEVRTATDPVLVASSARSLGEVLNVVLENALAHGRGTVRVDVRGTDDLVIVAVADEGSFGDGTTAGDASRDRSGEGIGLGLAHLIAEAVGARVVLAGPDPTTFELRIPRREDALSRS